MSTVFSTIFVQKMTENYFEGAIPLELDAPLTDSDVCYRKTVRTGNISSFATLAKVTRLPEHIIVGSAAIAS